MKYTPVKSSSRTSAKAASASSASQPAAQAAARPKSGKVVVRRAVPPGEVRIIGGLYKRTKLPVANQPGLRPTPDRVRETLFNWLQQDLSGWRCVDAFAGTGVLGFEAASRGAAEVLVCEQAPKLVEKLQTLKDKLQASMVRVERGDGVSLLRRMAPGSLQLVFLDPPYESTVFESALKAAAQAVAQPGFIYLEAPKTWTDDELAGLGLSVHRQGRAGAVHFHLLVKTPQPT